MADFENESINIYESIYESIDDILKKTFPNSKYTEDTSSSGRGSFNSVTKYIGTSNDKTHTKDIVVRQSVDSLLQPYIPEQAIRDFINEQNDDIVTKKRKHIDEGIIFEHVRSYVEQNLLISKKNDINRDHSNWKNASDNGISPQLFSYGFLIKEHQPDNDYNIFNFQSISRPSPKSYSVHTIIISEAYDMSLFEFYKENKKQGEPQPIGYQNRINNTDLQDIDIIIATQLIDLFTKLHNVSKLICFDIKPANFVIKIINETNFDVKMIDLDMDWCHDYYYKLLTPTGVHAPRELIKDLSIMILANQFYYYLKWNIFQKYINENKKMFGERKEALYELFCEVDKRTDLVQKLAEDYQFINKHYLYHANLKRTGSDGEPLQPPEDCSELFDEMFTNMHGLNPPEPRVSPRPPSSIKKGGKLKKKKTKKNKKRKMKSKIKTKRKRT